MARRKLSESTLTDDPKPRDRVMWQRLRLLVEDEACHRDWGCALYRLHRTGRIDNDQREAGDKFIPIAREYKKLVHEPLTDILGLSAGGESGGLSLHKQTGDIRQTRQMIASAWAENLKEATELEQRRDERTTKRYKEASAVAGQGLSLLEALLLDDVWPVGERGLLEVSHALTRLSHFFSTGTKRKR
jgi:hypothetical protein